MSENMKNYLRKLLTDIQDTFGTEVAVNKAKELLKESTKAAKDLNSKELAGEFRGELSEALLQIYLREFVKNNPNSFYIKGLTIKKTVGQVGYTELDLTLFTSRCVYLFESKSYSSDTILTDKCLLVTKRYAPVDVYAQSVYHLNNFKNYIDHARLCKTDELNPYKIIMFSLALGEIDDQRNAEWRKKIPLLTQDNIIEYMSNIESKQAVWDIEKLYNTVSKLQKSSNTNFNKHMLNMTNKKR